MLHPRRFALAPLLALALAGCASAAPPAKTSAPAARAKEGPIASDRGIVREGTPEGVNIAAARARGRERAFTWEPWGPAAFERARREHKLILLDGAAEWCHWCHVMDETTYLDPDIGRTLKEKFVTIRVDVDERPDIAERYGEWGWPATIVFSPEAEEIGKYRGYLPPDEMKAMLADVTTAAAGVEQKPIEGSEIPLPIESLSWIGGFATVQLDSFYDEAQGGWGQRQKAPLGANIEFEVRRAAHGNAAARPRVAFTAQKQRALLDPVWGGVYQYSTGGTWTSPHYEKLMTYQAENLEGYARAYTLLKDVTILADAQLIVKFMNTFLSNEGGAFLPSQDADVGAHSKGALFVDGDVYYRLSDPERRKLGVPRVDEHVYAHENGLAISAFAALYEATRDAALLARARKAADLILRTLVGPDGAVRRGSTEKGARYLADAASFGLALCRLAEVTSEVAYREAAVKIAAAMERDLADPTTGALWAHTPDPAAAGVFRRRDRPFAHNVTAARFFAALARLTGDAAYRDKGRKVLVSVFTPANIAGRGRMVGELLLALDDLGVYPWTSAPLH